MATGTENVRELDLTAWPPAVVAEAEEALRKSAEAHASSTRQQIAAARLQVQAPASKAQADAGNYRKGHIRLHGLEIAIENGKGSTRSGTSREGKAWRVTMTADYGYVKRTEGADGDHVDCFIGDDPDTELAFVINQVDPKTQKFDEVKVMLGYPGQDAAEKAYLAHYEAGWQGLGSVAPLTITQFKDWLANGDTTKPVSVAAYTKVAATGIPDRTNFGDLSKLPPGLVDFVIQLHAAQRAGEHRDVRLGTPQTGLYSWATKHELPEPGARRALYQQPVHQHGYKDFQGTLTGYGAGTVRTQRKGKVLVTKAAPGLVEFTTADQRYPERFRLFKPAAWKDKDWLLVNVTPRTAVPYEKVRYKRVPAAQVEPALEQLQEGDTVEAKIDGASTLVRLLERGAEVTSYRVSGQTGRPIVHTERMFHGRPDWQTPKELVGTVLRGELYGVRDEDGQEKTIPPQELGGLLNATLANSIEQQKARNIRLRNMIFDIQQYGNQPVDLEQVPRAERRRMMEEVMKAIPDKGFHLSQAVEASDARRLWQQIGAGEHPITAEGIVVHPAVGRPWKGKYTEDADVHVTNVFPGEGRLAGTGAGGFEYALEPGGEPVGRIGTGFSDELRRELWQDPQAYVGRVAKIRAQEQHPSGAYRAPAFLAWHEDYPVAAKTAQEQRDETSVPTAERTASPSIYLAALRNTMPAYDPARGAVQNLIQHVQRVRSRGDQAIREAYTRDSFANAAEPGRAVRQFSSYLSGQRQPIVQHWLDRVTQGDPPMQGTLR